MSEDIKNQEIIEDAVEQDVSVEEAVEETVEEVLDEMDHADKKKKMMKAGYHKKTEAGHEDDEEDDEEEVEEMAHADKKKKKKMEAGHKDDDEEEDDDMDEMDHADKKKKMMKAGYKKEAASYKVNAEEIDVKEDIDAMLKGQDLSEEFQVQVQTIFEAAVIEKVNTKLESIVSDMNEDYDAEIEANVAEIRNELSEKVDEYLSYVAKEYVNENKLAVENKLKLEIMENFMSGLKKVFEENYVDVPEEKVDLYGEALNSLEEKENKLNEQFEKNIKLSKNLEELEKEVILRDVTKGLTETQIEKVRSLSENLEYEDRDDMAKRITLIKENYFPSETIVESAVLDESALETSVEDSPVVQEENKPVNSIMDIYAKALNSPKD